MSLQPRRLFLTLALLVLGAVFGHAAEHEGWLHGVFHDASVETCGHSHADCPSHDHDRATCECHGPAAGVLPASFAASILPAVNGDVLASDPRVVARVPARPAARLPRVASSLHRPPRVALAGRAPLLI